jgi:hypothetical protein
MILRKRRPEMRRDHVSKKAIAMACTFALALALAAIRGVSARTQDNSVKTYSGIPSPRQEDPQVGNLLANKHVLNSVFFDSSGGNVASCSTTRCTATALLFTESIACPGPAGTKCTYEVDIATQTNVSPALEYGLYQFLIDGAAPNGGGTDSSGFYPWEFFGATGSYTSAYNVESEVKNTSTNQSHSIVVNIGCTDLGFGGCIANAGFSSLTVRVLRP